MGDRSAFYLSTLDRRFAPRVVEFVNAVRGVGVPLVIISGRRSQALQAALIRSGRTAATRSRHLTGNAVDVQWQGLRVAEVPAEWWVWIGSVGEVYGLRWGGRFSSPDVNHFDAG